MGLFGPTWYEQKRPPGYVEAKKYKGMGQYRAEVNKAIAHGWKAG